MTVLDVKNKNHTKAKMFLDPGGVPSVQRFDVVKYRCSLNVPFLFLF